METVKIGELPEEKCVSLYKKLVERDTDEETVKLIVRKAARLTIVVELLAKTAKNANLSDKKLLDTRHFLSLKKSADTLTTYPLYSFGNCPINERCISISCDCLLYLCPGTLTAS